MKRIHYSMIESDISGLCQTPQEYWDAVGFLSYVTPNRGDLVTIDGVVGMVMGMVHGNPNHRINHPTIGLIEIHPKEWEKMIKQGKITRTGDNYPSRWTAAIYAQRPQQTFTIL